MRPSFSDNILFKDPFDLSDSVRMRDQVVAGRNDQFRFCSIEMRASIGNDSIGAVGSFVDPEISYDAM